MRKAPPLCAPVRPAAHSTLFRRFGKLPGIAAALVLACCGAGAAAATYYVDVNYDQSNGGSDGSASRPFTNITAAVAAANANAGRDAIMIADGVYKSVNVGGYEDFGTAGITITGFVDIYGGYEGMTAGTWSSNRAPRTTVIDLAGAGARAFVDNLPTHNSTGVRYDGLTFVNANHSLPGGAIRCAGGYAVGIFVENCLFSNNVTSGNGGALSANESECNSFVNNCDFIDNAAGGSGGAFHSEYWGYRTTYFTNNLFLRNRAANVGGAVCIAPGTGSGGTIIFDACSFEGNTASNMAGAFFSSDGAGTALYIRNSVFQGNSAPVGAAMGGTAYWEGEYALVNCLVWSNTGGYAIHNNGNRSDGYQVDMSHCTVADNPGGGVYVYRQEGSQGLRIRNCIIVSNGNVGVYYNRNGGNFPVIEYNDVWGHSIADYQGDASAGNGSISADPLFMNPGCGDYHPVRGSPCVDAGTNLSITADLDGTMRPTRNGFDVGCYEEKYAIALRNLAPVVSATNAVLRGEMIYDGLTNADAFIFWGFEDGSTNLSSWRYTNHVGIVPAAQTFEANVTNIVAGSSYWFRCYASNWYDGVWANESFQFEVPASGRICLWTGAGTNALASNPDNWFGGLVPGPCDMVKLDNISSNVTWDAAASQSVFNWEQTEKYTGIVTIATGWSNGFDQLTVSNDFVIRGGTVRHVPNPAGNSALYRLKLDIRRNFRLDSSASVSADGLGYGAQCGPGAGLVWSYAGSHGGEGYSTSTVSLVYGNPVEPETLGSGGYHISGGGAVYISVCGTATLNGVISANGGAAGHTSSGGAGGSVFLRAGWILGEGSISADGSGLHYESKGGGGGRVAVVVTNGLATGNVRMHAYGGNGDAGRNGAAGTVYREIRAYHMPGRGVLTLDNNNLMARWARTIIPTNWPLEDFEEIWVTNRGVLGLCDGATFNFASPPASLRWCGPSASFLTIRPSNNAVFPSDFVIDGYTLRLDGHRAVTGNWTVAQNGTLSHSWNDSIAIFGLDLDLYGNLTVNGAIDASGAGYALRAGPGYPGGGTGSYGGLGWGAPAGRTYGSALNPSDHGSGSYYGCGGGCAHLNVVGRLSIDGAVRSDAASVWNVDGSGGSLWISAREIAGTGAVTSVGGAYRTNPGWEERGGGGGRIALRITAAEYQASLSLLACGGKGGPGCPSAVGGAGTIYIEDVNCPQGGGWCIVDNNNVGTNGWTEWPASMWGDAAEPLRGVRLTITNAACLRLSTNVIVGNLFLGTNSVLDLNGYTCRVDATRHALAGLVVSNGGALFWGRKGTVFAVR